METGTGEGPDALPVVVVPYNYSITIADSTTVQHI